MSATPPTPARRRLPFVRSTPTVIGDLDSSPTAPAARRRSSRRSTTSSSTSSTMTEPEEIWYTSFDGKKIQGWILKPPAFDASKKYPLILADPRRAAFRLRQHLHPRVPVDGGEGLRRPLHEPARQLELRPGVRQHAFSSRYPGDDYKDLMAGVDEVLKKGYVDETRLGVTGGSGGGLLTNWSVTQTTRFKAAVSQRDISDWANFWYTADFTLFTPTWFRKAPFEDPADFATRSPITHVDEDPDAADVHPWRRGLADAAGGRRRGPVPRVEVPEAPDGRWCASPARATSSHARASPGTASSASSTSSDGSTSI